jgi:hypothetical protein
MNATSLIIGVFKPSLRKKFEFNKIHSVTFKANTITDTLDLSGIGTTTENFEPHTKNMDTLKLSENSEFVQLFLNQIRDKANFKEVKASEITLNFIDSKAETTIYYINENDVKCKKQIEIKF